LTIERRQRIRHHKQGSDPMSSATPAPVVTQGEVFSRRATGLVRLGTPWRVLVLNFANIGLTYIWFTFWITPGVFPRSNLFLSLAVAGLGTAVFAVVLAAFSSSFPRSGGEYVYVSRTLHPSIGFGCSVAAALSQCFWVGIGGSWIANLVLAPVLAAFSASTGSATLGDWSTSMASPDAGFILGTVCVALCMLINLGGLRTYFRFQTISLAVGVVSLVALMGVFVFSSESDFSSGLDKLAASAGGSPTAFQDLASGAQAAGMPGGVTLHDTFGIVAITWLLAFISTYIAGEVRSPRRTQTVGTVGGTLVYTAVVMLLLAAIAIPVTLAFNKSAAWMSYNSDTYAEILPLDPTFVTWASALVDNPVLLAVVGFGLVVWSFFWLPSAMIAATRTIFAWSMERLVPARLSEVHRRTNAPIAATLTVVVIAELFLVAYWRDWFTYLTPFLAYACVFSVVSIAAIVAGFKPSARAQLATAGWDIRVAGVPIVSACGVVGLLYWGAALYFALSVDALALNTTKQLTLTAAQFLVPFAAFFAVSAWRSSRGIRLSAAYAQLPPE
jgi:basic amino acid/polyamine antiporter, APA family